VACGVAAGFLGVAASLTKQNFLDGLVFAGVLCVVLAVQQRRDPRGLVLGCSLGGGVVMAYGLVALWAALESVSMLTMWADVVTFRGEAAEVIVQSSLRAPARRAATLVLLAVLSAALPIAVTWALWLRRRPGTALVEHWAVAAMLACGLAGVVGGGSYWPHYLQQLVPGLALAAGMVICTHTATARTMRAWARWAVASALVCLVGMTAVYAVVPYVAFPQHIGGWLASSAEESDTVFVAYGNPQILEGADLGSPYPYVWSLQMRTLDPDQARLRTLLRGDDAPTWVVQTTGLNAWDIDRGGRLAALLQRRYEHVADVCGYPVFLRADAERELARVPSCDPPRE
jgi:hypothetical protein